MTGLTFTELTGGRGCSIVSATPGPDLAAHGYTETEYAVAGVAERLDSAEDATVVPAGSAPFTTRALVRRPCAGSAFNGTVVVEWLNVSSGADAAPEYTYLAEELIRGGYAWVGVSAQYTGIAGGAGSVELDRGVPSGLADKDPERYGALHHPGDGYCHGIFGAIGATLRAGSAPLDGLSVRQVLAAGESQSAMALTTYANLFARRHGVFDGILIHSRAASHLPLGEPGRPIDIARVFDGDPTHISDDVGVPVLIVQTETDVLTNFEFYRARQPDTDLLRVWEVAGTSHADLHQIGPYEEMLGCPTPVNRGQQRFVLRAGLAHLRRWAGGGDPPPSKLPLELDTSGAAPTLALDDVGNARGGVRSPCVDVATQVLSGVVDGEVTRICQLFGSTTSADPAVLAARYADADDYLRRYREAIDTMIAAGFALEADRAELDADARPDLVTPRSGDLSRDSTRRL